MANGTFIPHQEALEQIANGNIDLENDTFHLMILNGWVPDPDTDNFWSDISANEISLSGYTANGNTLTGVTLTRDNANDRVVWDFADSVWAALAAGSASYAAVVWWTGVASTSVVIGNVELVTQPNGGDYTIATPATGALRLTRNTS